MKRSLGSCLAGIGIVVCSQAPVIAAHAQTDAPEWDTRFVDRHPGSDDLKLPMPCGGSMVFRPVDVATGKTVLGDVEIMTGRNDAVDGYNEFLHKSWISAPFPVPGKPDLRRYYVAKYDVTQNQYDAVMHPDAACRPPTAEGMKPAIRVSWFDAQNFTATWTSWLLAHHAATLPTHGNGHGFVRLPTEDEWSYAARGGMQVSPADFMAPTWPMPEGNDHYIVAGPDIGALQPVGTLKPNPLGLYDILGEVDQIMLDPYRLNRVGRLHGQVGGVLLRGGNYLANPDELTTAQRAQMPVFDEKTSQPTRLPTAGIRVIISSDVINTLVETQEAQAEFDKLYKNQQSSDPSHSMLADMQNNTTDNKLRDQLRQVQAVLASNARERADAAMEALKLQINATTVMAISILQTEHAIHVMNNFLQSSSPIKFSAEQRAPIEKNLARNQRNLNGMIGGYLDLVRSIHSNAAFGQLNEAVQLVKAGMEQRHEDYGLALIGLVQSEIGQQEASVTAAEVLKDIDQIARTLPGEGQQP